MSTKTSIKRIALVAVSALGFGLLSVVPAKADAATSHISGFKVLQEGNRSGLTSALNISGVANTATEAGDTFAVHAALTAKPAGSLLDLGNETVFTMSAANITFAANGAASASTSTQGTWLPDQPGTYRAVVWNDNDGGNDRDAGERATTVTIEVVSDEAPISVTVTTTNSTTVAGGSFGSAMTIAIKNSKGIPTRLGAFEQINLEVTKSSSVFASTDTDGAALALDETVMDGTAVDANNNPAPETSGSLTQENFSKGISYLNVTNAAAAVSVLTITGEANTALSGLRRTVTITFKADDTAAQSVDTALGLDNDGDGAFDNDENVANQVTIPAKTAATATFAGVLDPTDTHFATTDFFGVSVEDTSDTVNAAYAGLALGAEGWGYDRAISANADGEYSFDISAAFLDGVQELTVIAFGVTKKIQGDTPAADALAPVNGVESYRTLDGSTLSFTLKMTDQFGSALANETVDVSVSGRNSKSATLVTDASGLITYSFTDTVGTTGSLSSDNVVFDGAVDATLAVTYVSSYGVSTVTLSYPGEDDTVAGTTSTDISAAAGGATGSSASIVATVKDENGSILVGVPVTFAVAGLTGAEVHTNTATVNTGADGKATGKVSSYAAGKATVTVTSGGKSATADIYFKQQTPEDARTITATASNGIVTATVKDRYGNPIKDVTVKATRSGTGFFGSGSSSAEGSTDKNGVVDFYFNGTGTVTVGFDGDEYGQSADAAGKVGTTAVTASAAGTALVAQKGLGASLAPAGVNSVTLSVEGTSAATEAATAAADAAAEAIDAANAATDAANLAAEAADAATVAAEEARDAADAATAAVEELATQVATLMAALKAQITTLANTVAKIAKKVRA
jgi:hypothetical protein